MPDDVLIAVGSNIDPEIHIPSALDLLNEQCPIRAVSTFYRTQAVAHDRQPEFVNGACLCTVTVPPRELKFGILRAIEAKIGRVRTADAHAPREIDLDIGLIGDLMIEESDLIIPDPDIASRAFVAIPFAEIAPDAILPTTGQKLSELASSFHDDALRPETGINELLRLRFSQ